MSNTETREEIKGMAGEVPVYCAHDAIIPLSDIVGHPKNPNVHPPEQIEKLKEIIMKQGWRSPIVISKRSGFVTKGHGRLMAALDGDMEFAPVDYQEYENEAKEYEDMIADNRLAELSTMEHELLAEIFEELDDIDYSMTGYTEDEISDIMGEIEDIEEAEEKKPDREFSPFVLAGDAWYLGEHRFIVGETDSMADYLIAQYVYQTGNVGITCIRNEKEYAYIELLRAWAEDNGVTDEVFSAKKPVILMK